MRLSQNLIDLYQLIIKSALKSFNLFAKTPKTLLILHRVFHSIRFKVNKGWVTAVTLFYVLSSFSRHFRWQITIVLVICQTKHYHCQRIFKNTIANLLEQYSKTIRTIFSTNH